MTNVEDGIKEGSSDHVEHAEETAMPKEPQRITVSASHQAFIRKKFDYRVLPIVCILYTLSYLDRGNIGNAKTAGLQADLGLNDSQWAWVLNAFYVCYVLFEWTVLLWKLMPAHIYVASLCVFWGAAAMCSGAVNNMAQLIVCRCFLGIFEASFGAGAPYFLSLFYQRHELGFRVSMLLGMSPVANCFSSALAYGITQIKGSIQPWRLLFIIEGAPTVAFAVVVFFFLADSPGTAKFLNESEKTEAIERLQTVDLTARSSVQWRQVFQGLGDYKNYVHTLIHFCCNYSFAGLSNFLPTIIASMGYDSVTAQGLTAPTYFASFLFCIAAALLTDRYGRRGLAVAGFALLGTAGYLVLAVVENMQARYAGVWLAVCGVFPALCMNITWLLNNQGGDSKRGAGMALLAIFGQCSSFASSSLFPKSDSPFYVKGSAVGCGLTGCIAILALGLYLALDRENKRRDRVWGEVSDDTHVDVTQGGDKNPRFRYLI